MRKNIVTLLLSVILLSACTNNEPKVYTSIAGLWNCVESSTRGKRIYGIDIVKTVSLDTYTMYNFDNTGNEEFGITVKLKNSVLTIDGEQQVNDLTVKAGSGTVSSDFKRISLEYTVYDSGQDIKVQAIYTRN